MINLRVDLVADLLDILNRAMGAAGDHPCEFCNRVGGHSDLCRGIFLYTELAGALNRARSGLSA